MKEYLIKNKVWVLAGIGVLFLLIGTFVVVSNKEEDQSVADNIETKLNTSTPSINGEDIERSKMKAYEQARKDSLWNARYNDEKINLETPGASNNDKGDMDFRIDSILNANKITYKEEAPKKPRQRSYNNNRNKQKKQTQKIPEKTIEDEFNDLFSKKNKTSSNGETKSSFTNNEAWAVINGDQNISNRDRVELRLTKDFIWNNKKFKRNTIFFGIAQFQQKRINITVTTIRHTPVKLQVYDEEDGMLGIHTSEQNLLGETKDRVGDNALEGAEELDRVPGGGVVRNIFNKRKKREDIKVPLLNNTSIRLKLD